MVGLQHLTSEEAKVGPPVLDLAPFFENESGHGVLERRSALLEEINKAALEWGLFQVINHGLGSSLLSEALENAKDFFALSLEEKLKLKTENSMMGFVHDIGKVGDGISTQRLVFAMEDHPLSVYNAWPETRTNFRSKTEELVGQARNTADFLMTIMSQSLGLSKGAIQGAFKEPGDRYILSRYPAAMTDDQIPALPKHQDANCFTLIAQLNQVEGYQLLKDGESEWVTVQPVKDALIVNIGDVLQVLTNGKYKSVVHRVVPNKKERFTFVYSRSPGVKEQVVPLPQFTAEANEPPRYRPFKYEELYKLKLEKNITIEHYATNAISDAVQEAK